MEAMVGYKGVYKGRRVLVTGHTGFKGSWLSLWLTKLGAEVVGVSLYLPSDPCNFSACNLAERVKSYEADIRDAQGLQEIFHTHKPEIVFHLAAQPIVLRSLEEPRLTFETNLMGTINVMECVKNTDSVRAAVMITSDKCYENMEWERGYTEDDRLGGRDPYSASKACAEVAIGAYTRCYFTDGSSPLVATARAGNVIGGGDWADDRVVPDCVRAISGDLNLTIRNPQATRPWQHVFEPLSGYLVMGQHLLQRDTAIRNRSYNFGPSDGAERTVHELVQSMGRSLGRDDSWITVEQDEESSECTLLKLNCDRAAGELKWKAILNFDETIRMTADWYRHFYDNDGSSDMRALCEQQIEEFTALARERSAPWAR